MKASQKVYKPKPMTVAQANDNRLFFVFYLALFVLLVAFG